MKPFVMLGECTGKMLLRIQELGWGRMFVRMTPRPYPGEVWGFDNGAFALHAPGGSRRFVGAVELKAWESTFLASLSKAREQDQVPFVTVCPDLPFQGGDSLVYSHAWSRLLPGDWPWFLAVQDGMDPFHVEAVLDATPQVFSGLFLGGTNSFKYQAHLWCDLAHTRGLKFHYGRCGTPAKLRHAHAIRADSVDSALPMWTKENLARFIRAYDRLGCTIPLWQ